MSNYRVLVALPCIGLMAMAFPAVAAVNAANGKLLYGDTRAGISCAAPGACHGADPTQNANNVLNGANNAAKISAAIGGGVAAMTFLQGKFSAAEIMDIAAYLGNPNVGASPVLSVSTTTLNFSSVNVGASKALQATLTNTGAGNLSVNIPALTGANAADFAISSNTCTAAVAANGTCVIGVTFHPSAADARSASLAINSNGGSATVNLTGSGAGQATVSLNAPAGGLTFPDTVVGAPASAATNQSVVTLSNSGTASLTIASIAVSPDFVIDSTAVTACKSSSPVVAGGTCTITTKFQPISAGAKSGAVSIAHNATGSPSTIALAGTGLATPKPAAILSTSVLDFGNVAIGLASTPQTVTLTNGGGAPLTISAIADGNATEFIRSGTCGTGVLAPGADCSIVVSLMPVSAGAKTGTVTITDDAGGVANTLQVLALTGIAKASQLPPAPALSPSQLDFGDQEINSVSSVQIVTITNSSGSDPLDVTDISVDGANASEFVIDRTVTNACAVARSIVAGESCSVGVTFTPIATGSRAAGLAFATNATGSPHKLALLGTGSAAPGAPSNPTPAPSSNVGNGGCAAALMPGAGDRTLPLLFLVAAGALLIRRTRRHSIIS